MGKSDQMKRRANKKKRSKNNFEIEANNYLKVRKVW